MEPRENNSFVHRAPSSHVLAAVGGEGPENGAPKAARRDARLHQTASPLREVHAVNEYCIDVLVRAARSSRPGTLPLVAQLRDVLVEMTPAIRERAARRSFLLTDMEFGNAGWWSRVVSYPLRSVGAPRSRGSLARPCAVQLARATLTLAWHSVRADRRAAGVLLGMSETVADVLATSPCQRLNSSWGVNSAMCGLVGKTDRVSGCSSCKPRGLPTSGAPGISIFEG